MDIYSLLKKDHETVSALFKKLSQTSSSSNGAREEIFDEIKLELTAHSESEKAAFYDPLSKKKEAYDIILDANAEHDAITDLLEEISSMMTNDKQWMAKCTELQEIVEEHVKEEEGEIFKIAKKILDPSVAEQMGEKFLNLKEQCLDRSQTSTYRKQAANTEHSDSMP